VSVVRVEDELSRHATNQETVVTIGVFDGVHLGHRHLMERVKKRARETERLSGVVTFHPHPRRVLSEHTRLPYLTGLAERERLIHEQGIDLVVPLTFTHLLAGLSAREFMMLLRKYLNVRGLVIGPDFAMGRGRAGDAAALTVLGQERGFGVEVVPPLELEGRVVSSTAIRKSLAEGDMATANKLLARPFRIRGSIEKGVGRGRTIGIPTANVVVDIHLALPPDGVYVTRAYVDTQTYPSITNIGRRPTFDNGERTIEVHILDFEGDLYRQELAIDVIERVRPEMRFGSAGELKAQIERDIEKARQVLGEKK